VAGGDLDVAQVNACVEHGRDERVPEHMRMCPGDLDTSRSGEQSESAGGRMPVHSRAAIVEEDRPGTAAADGTVDGPAHCRAQRD
jgi:hypothetical protein